MKSILAILFLIVSFSGPAYAGGYWGFMGPGVGQGFSSIGPELEQAILLRAQIRQQQAYEDRQRRVMEQNRVYQKPLYIAPSDNPNEIPPLPGWAVKSLKGGN